MAHVDPFGPAGARPAAPPPPPRLRPPLRTTRPPRRPDPHPANLAFLALAGGVAFDLGLRGGIANAIVAVGVATVAVALVLDGRVEGAQARWLAASAVVPAAFLAWRTSPWLLTCDVVAVGGLLGAAILHAQSGSVLDTTPLRLLRRSAVAVPRAFSGVAVLRPLVPGVSRQSASRVGRIALAVVIALPMLAVMVLLLASADAVFASLLVPDVDTGPALGHVVLIALFGFGVLGTVTAALGDADGDAPGGDFGAIEVVTMLGLAAAILGLFVVSQLVALTDAGDRLVESSGLTPAEYARSGFFQLCWATAVLVGFLALVRALAKPDVRGEPPVRILGGVVPLLALGLVAVSLRRMALYDDAFGLTMLRLWVVGAAVWMGGALVMIALRNLGVGGDRNWVVAGAGATGLTLLLLANVANPEAFVVRHNVARAEDGAELDASYLTGLSDDALPAIADAAAQSPDPSVRRALVRNRRCGPDRAGVAALNLAAARAAEARDALCQPRN